jgi:hypothetical protein
MACISRTEHGGSTDRSPLAAAREHHMESLRIMILSMPFDGWPPPQAGARPPCG